ncbi:hydrogenase accessory protein HypB [Magnetococcus marinus MC-1]|uniref:Hydrogenase maturation factor HypB n=1 Tax=Magnetococcus marinus (strain ATCC BAA-1437 / JCM 17883 / MC-1) TaxID=156889 RepID=A0LAJ5_MAGMM|nr:hydrogenase nickel incorporation protein HypB [Magnetococcus marinus]ABK44988.1 hydrogenase accessory protein HypB [Magnetococcus marinus MC-1]
MCDTCGCNLTPGTTEADGQHATETVAVMAGLMANNDRRAAHNRLHFDRHGVLAVNLMSSPGSGKTALLEATIVALKDEFRMAVVEGDLETENDAQRIRAQGVPAVQITTGNACHLDAAMVHDALHELDLTQLDLIFVENVGNLVCPAGFDLGHHHDVVLLSVTEGDDKPSKYPVMFRQAELLLLSKCDLLAVLEDFDPVAAEKNLRALANGAPVLPISARKGVGMQAWFDWLRQAMHAQRARLVDQPQGGYHHHHDHNGEHHHHDHDGAHHHDHDGAHHHDHDGEHHHHDHDGAHHHADAHAHHRGEG